jgi:ankyrin repeat protein
MADDGRTPLSEAAAAGAADCILYLSEGCFVPIRDEVVSESIRTGEHALQLAARSGHAGAVDVLLRLGARANRVDACGRSALWEAAR